jgi:hypothetical protein
MSLNAAAACLGRPARTNRLCRLDVVINDTTALFQRHLHRLLGLLVQGAAG